ncbi:MAG: poly-gamma-glutamate hydrolase family protein [Desulfocapsaceae bacterium]
MADRYRKFEELSRYESEFSVDVQDRTSDVTILAPHGGRIEPSTSEVAALIAGDDYNLFCFNGLKDNDNRDLHITSHRFDHPQALSLVSKSSYVIAVHGCTVNKSFIYLGGLDKEVIRQISYELENHQIDNEWGNYRFRGTHRHNICNRGRFKRGVQLELSRGVRDSGSAHIKIGLAVKSAIATLKNNRES